MYVNKTILDSIVILYGVKFILVKIILAGLFILIKLNRQQMEIAK